MPAQGDASTIDAVSDGTGTFAPSPRAHPHAPQAFDKALALAAALLLAGVGTTGRRTSTGRGRGSSRTGAAGAMPASSSVAARASAAPARRPLGRRLMGRSGLRMAQSRRVDGPAAGSIRRLQASTSDRRGALGAVETAATTTRSPPSRTTGRGVPETSVHATRVFAARTGTAGDQKIRREGSGTRGSKLNRRILPRSHLSPSRAPRSRRH